MFIELELAGLHSSYLFTAGRTQLIIALTLAVGAILLLKRDRYGRTIIALGCGVAIASSLVALAVHTTLPDADLYAFTLSPIVSLITLALAITTVVLTYAESTKRWLAQPPNGA
ncbi:hypothetical protein [Rhodococcus sp. M8-35]|uniref:hypothetical protein n=1 Tax=Rhodococcus sp. M8-35 TaxID=3058401 RepID=UPI002ED1F8BC